MRIKGRIQIPESLKKFLVNPTPKVNEAMNQATKLILMLLQESIKTNIWHSKTGDLKDSIDIDIDKRTVFTNLVYASAQEKGHYAEPVNKLMLHFEDAGKDVFMRFTRSKPKPFFFKSISQNKQQIDELFDDVVKKMLNTI